MLHTPTSRSWSGFSPIFPFKPPGPGLFRHREGTKKRSMNQENEHV
jgi:hypothetical protein